MDRADAGGGLGWAEFQPTTDLVQRPHARVDDDLAPVQVDAVPLQAGELAPAHAGVGGGDDQYRVVRRHSGGERGDLVGGGVRAFGAVCGVDAELAAGVGAEQSFVDGFAEDHRQQAGDVGDALLGEGARAGSSPRP